MFAPTTIFMFGTIQYPSTDQLNFEDVSGLPGGEHFTWKAPSISLQKLARNESMETLSWVISCHMVIVSVQEAAWLYSILQYLTFLEPSNHFITHFSSSRDLLCCSALARAMAPVSVRSLSLRLQWYNQIHNQRDFITQHQTNSGATVIKTTTHADMNAMITSHNWRA